MTRVLKLRQQAWRLLETARTFPDDSYLRAALVKLSRDCEILSVEMEEVVTREALSKRAAAVKRFVMFARCG